MPTKDAPILKSRIYDQVRPHRKNRCHDRHGKTCSNIYCCIFMVEIEFLMNFFYPFYNEVSDNKLFLKILITYIKIVQHEKKITTCINSRVFVVYAKY